MKQNDRELTRAKLYAVGQIAFVVVIVAGIIWLWGWEAGITAIVVLIVALPMLTLGMIVAVAGNSHLRLAFILAVGTAVLYLISLLVPFIYGEWLAVSWLIGVAPLAYVNAERLIDKLKQWGERRRTPKY